MYTLFTWVALWNACCMVGLHAGHAKAVRISQGIGCSGSSRRSGSSPRRIGFICVFGPRRRTGNSGDRVTAVQPPDVDNERWRGSWRTRASRPAAQAACSSRLPVRVSRRWSGRVSGAAVRLSGPVLTSDPPPRSRAVNVITRNEIHAAGKRRAFRESMNRIYVVHVCVAYLRCGWITTRLERRAQQPADPTISHDSTAQYKSHTTLKPDPVRLMPLDLETRRDDAQPASVLP